MSNQVFFGKKYSKNILEYFYEEGLNKYFPFDERTKKYSAFHGVKKIDEPYHAELDDLVRLHKLVRKRKVFTILEFGVGYSTIVMADAIKKNQIDFQKNNQKPNIRISNQFKIFSVDTSKDWIQKMKKSIPKNLKKNIQISHSEVYLSTFNDRICHYYQKIPNIIPDFIYVDGPFNLDIRGEKNGLNYKNLDRTVMMGDLLLMEPTMLPGTLILFDGRTNNARFSKNNFQRQYNYKYDKRADITTIELIEEPIGEYNENQIIFCLGKNHLKKMRKV